MNASPGLFAVSVTPYKGAAAVVDAVIFKPAPFMDLTIAAVTSASVLAAVPKPSISFKSTLILFPFILNETLSIVG